LIISENPKFICFQPWKCGSSTLHLRLKNFDSNRYPQAGYFNEVLGKISHKHIGLKDFSCLPESRSDYIRFTFVRNPYDRLYSGFLQRRHRLTTNPPKHVLPEKINEELSFIERGFGDFLEYYLATKGTAIQLCNHVYLNDKPAVDFVGFLETFEASFSQICDSIGIHNADDGNANVRFSEIEQSKSSSTAQYRYIDKFDRRSIDAVNEVFMNDFGNLGYRMINPDDLGEDRQLIDHNLSPFSGSIMPERRGDTLTFDRRSE